MLKLRYHLIHRHTADAATENMSLDAQLTIVHNIRNSKNKQQNNIQCEYICIQVDGRQHAI